MLWPRLAFSVRAISRVLPLGVLLGVALLAPAQAVPAGLGSDTSIRVQQHRLRLFNLHTNDRIDIVYRRGDAYVAGSVEQLDNFLRDHRTGDVIALDPKLFDLLNDVTAANEMLRNAGHEVAKHSQHILGEAIDIRIPGVSTARLRDAALGLHRGGVGYYPQSQFVHVDLGPVRHWQAS
jgi:uncharacterized protein YcbK (DUF882 family)